ncbi:DUF3592 domain-containing protein [Megasphaera paucivorans]|uniref:DUF3592 domain-containing protein n=1 Tax=Megasphaera paucivorans TaxID=349095 RepID=A0A1G9PXZ4_9FIRM|nr:DUF3592 domain-containing protein [Megasphaera paucivorans]SDM03533.1 Protein of unknown function [Megasphaera paucivorans]
MNILYYIPAVLGILFIGVGVYNGWKMRCLIRHCSQPVKGTIKGFDVKTLKSGDMYFPVVAYNVNDTAYRSRYEIGDSEWNFEAGDIVDIRYNPNRPEEIYLDHNQSIFRQYASPFFIIIGGLLFIVAYYKWM